MSVYNRGSALNVSTYVMTTGVHLDVVIQFLSKQVRVEAVKYRIALIIIKQYHSTVWKYHIQDP